MEKNFKHLYKKRVREKKQKKLANKVIVKHKLNWLENISIVISLWFILSPYPFYNALLVACIFLPLFGMYLNGLNKSSYVSLIEITVENGVVADVEMTDFISFPAIAICLRVLLDFNYDFWDSLPTPLALTILVFLMLISYLFFTGSLPQTRKFWVYSSILVNLTIYVFSTTLAVNTVFDKSEVIQYKTEVISKRISESARGVKSYHIIVEGWNNKEEAQNIRISKSDYAKFQAKSLVYINTYKGLLNIPWYSNSLRSRYSLSKN